MGTPDFAVGVLSKLVTSGKQVVGVVTAADKPAGRGRKLRPSAVKTYAESQQLPVLQPTKLRDPEFLEALEAMGANLFVIVAFRMLPKLVWNMPEYGTFNLHASLLPHYRGAAPINWAIIQGEAETGVTTFFIDEKIDTGAIIASKAIPVASRETAGSLHDKLMELGGELVVETVTSIEAGDVTPKAQPQDAEFKEAPKLHADNTRIDWNWDVQKIDRFVRGLSPFPAAWTQLDQEGDPVRVKIYLGAPVETQHDLAAGTLLQEKNSLKVAVSNGYFEIVELQLPGKRKMKTTDLLNGFSFEKEAKFF